MQYIRLFFNKKKCFQNVNSQQDWPTNDLTWLDFSSVREYVFCNNDFSISTIQVATYEFATREGKCLNLQVHLAKVEFLKFINVVDGRNF